MGYWVSGSSGSFGGQPVSFTVDDCPAYGAGGAVKMTATLGGTGPVDVTMVAQHPNDTNVLGVSGTLVAADSPWPGLNGTAAAVTRLIAVIGSGPDQVVLIYLPDGHPDIPEGGDAPPGSAAAIIPALIAGTSTVEGLPTDVVATTAPTTAVSSWDAAADIADRSEIRLVDRGSGWEALPALPTPGSVVLTIEAGVNLIAADSVVDIDQADWAQSVLVVYTWPEEWDDNPEDATPAVPITRRQIAWSSPQYGTDTLIERRDGVPATEAQAQVVADVLGARAWLRGHALEVTTVCCAWVRVADTVTVDLPWAPAADYWVAEARHDSQAATSTLTLRGFDLTYYPDA